MNVSKWGLLWVLGGVIAILGWKAFEKDYVKAVWILFSLHLGLYFFIYIIAPWDINVYLKFNLDRLILHTIPAVGFIISFHWREIGINNSGDLKNLG